MSTGRNDSMGPAWPRLSTCNPQPYWKTATITPKAAPAASRFIIAATAGTSRLRNASISSRNPSPMMTPMNSGSLPLITVAKSAKIAVTPPT